VPKFGIEKEVRVCDSCFDKLNKCVVDQSLSAIIDSVLLLESTHKSANLHSSCLISLRVRFCQNATAASGLFISVTSLATCRV